MISSSTRNAAFDGLRGWAAVCVVMFHRAAGHEAYASFSPLVKSVFLVGSRMVPIFFVLSGIFITSSLRIAFETRIRPRTDFALRRVFRIVPLWWLTLIWMYSLGQSSAEVLLANSVFFF